MIAVVVGLCPMILEPPWPEVITAEVVYEHERDGHPYRIKAEYSPVVVMGVYGIDAEGWPVQVKWSDGVECGKAPKLLFKDGFETATTEKWDGVKS